MEVLGIDPITRLVIPRGGRVRPWWLCCSTDSSASSASPAGYAFSVFLQGREPWRPSSRESRWLTGLPEVALSMVKAALFGMLAGLVACYRGLSVRGGPKGVGEAVNETVV